MKTYLTGTGGQCYSFSSWAAKGRWSCSFSWEHGGSQDEAKSIRSHRVTICPAGHHSQFPSWAYSHLEHFFSLDGEVSSAVICSVMPGNMVSHYHPGESPQTEENSLYWKRRRKYWPSVGHSWTKKWITGIWKAIDLYSPPRSTYPEHSPPQLNFLATEVWREISMECKEIADRLANFCILMVDKFMKYFQPSQKQDSYSECSNGKKKEINLSCVISGTCCLTFNYLFIIIIS